MDLTPVKLFIALNGPEKGILKSSKKDHFYYLNIKHKYCTKMFERNIWRWAGNVVSSF